MPFNSITFIVFFTIFSLIYFSVNNKLKFILLIAGSWFFYSYANFFNLIHLLLTTLITFYFATKIKNETNSRLYFFTGILLLLLQLILAKYTPVLRNKFSIFENSDDTLFSVFILPIGISFYSLQAISLLYDIRFKAYRNGINFKNISLFLAFFPQSVSGPIHRGNELIPQFSFENKNHVNNIIIGIKTMLWGYFCKLIIADKISILTYTVFKSYFLQDGLSLAFASLLYSLQIYFDFWGYSLIAIGVGKILGVSININFNAPYSITSFKEFWHRWHITLSKWMRDYIYIPLGGRMQKQYIFFCLTILTTFLVSGFWHGITLNFIIWGITHAILYLIEDFFRTKTSHLLFLKSKVFQMRFIKICKPILFFVVISFTWLIFRTENITELLTILKKICSFSNWSLINFNKNYYSFTNLCYILLILIGLILSTTQFIKTKIEMKPSTITATISDSVFLIFCITIIILLGDIGNQEFLYFKF